MVLSFFIFIYIVEVGERALPLGKGGEEVSFAYILTTFVAFQHFHTSTTGGDGARWLFNTT